MNFIYWNRGNYEEKNVNKILAVEDANTVYSCKKKAWKNQA